MEEGSKDERNKPSRGKEQEYLYGHGISSRRKESSIKTQNGKLDQANGKNVPKLHYEYNLSYFEIRVPELLVSTYLKIGLSFAITK